MIMSKSNEYIKNAATYISHVFTYATKVYHKLTNAG